MHSRNSQRAVSRRWLARLIAATVTLGLAVVLAPASPSNGDDPSPSTTSSKGGVRPYKGPILDRKLVGRAAPDECFSELTVTPTPIRADGTCPAGSKPKVNQTYIWSGARTGRFITFGTGANVPCVSRLYMQFQPFVNRDTTCQLQYGAAADRMGANSGDLTPSRVYRVDSRTDKMTEITPDDPLLGRIAGLRGGAGNNDVALLVGQALKGDGTPTVVGAAVFAFEGSTGRYLGSKVLPEIGALRNGVVASDGNLYFGARNNPAVGGSIYKWTGNKANPFQFEKVGNIGNEAGYITEHNGRLVASGWTTAVPFTAEHPGAPSTAGGPAQVWMGPKLRPGGLTEDDADDWESIFSYADYEADPLVAQSNWMGAVQSWRGRLYVGSYEYPFTNLGTVWKEYGRPNTQVGRVADYLGAERATSIFEISRPGKRAQKVRLLYGYKRMPVRLESGAWVLRKNLLGQTPKFGPAGFGNRFNYYSWTWTVLKDRLYMSTFDGSGDVRAARDIAAGVLGVSNPELLEQVAPALRFTTGGYDLWRMDNPNRPAVAETLNGGGNRSQYGIRVMLPFEDKGFFYAGTAGASNLRVGVEDPGGFELWRMTPRH
ncbi:hypothetical protein [Nocardioides sp. GXZ039]|uniref:hypothetical protein n=1 Tax=Nocardioides sp. GXZ039 TaxID=3136018 RepID=UPI0030F448E1